MCRHSLELVTISGVQTVFELDVHDQLEITVLAKEKNNGKQLVVDFIYTIVSPLHRVHKVTYGAFNYL